jgi:hypothetical protein
MMAPVANLPAPGRGVVDVIAADMHHPAGKDAVRRMLGAAGVRKLRKQRARWVGLIVGSGGVCVLPFDTEEEFLQLGANALVMAPYMSATLVLIACCAPELRARLLAATRAQELASAESGGHA